MATKKAAWKRLSPAGRATRRWHEAARVCLLDHKEEKKIKNRVRTKMKEEKKGERIVKESRMEKKQS